MNSSWAFGIVVGILEVAEIEVDLLRCAVFPVALLQPIQGNHDGLELLAPDPLGVDRPEGARLLPGDPPRTGVGDCQLTVCRWLRGEQPDAFPGLDGILLVSIPASSTLNGTGELDLGEPIGFELVVLPAVGHNHEWPRGHWGSGTEHPGRLPAPCRTHRQRG